MRLKAVMDSFVFSDDSPTKSTVEEVMSKVNKIHTVGVNTLFVQQDGHGGEQVTWVDPEGLSYGWMFLNYDDDYLGLTKQFRGVFDNVIEDLSDEHILYLSESEGQEVVIIIDNTPIIDIDQEVVSYVFFFDKSLQAAIELEGL